MFPEGVLDLERQKYSPAFTKCKTCGSQLLGVNTRRECKTNQILSVVILIVSLNASRFNLTCGVPSLSMRGTRWRGAYLASSLFILTSRRSPSVGDTQHCRLVHKITVHPPPPQPLQPPSHFRQPRDPKGEFSGTLYVK